MLEAKDIFIRMDGLDAIGSATKRWKAGMDIPYLARKARFVPATDLPYYASSFVRSRIHRVLSSDKRLAFWGPKLDNMQELLKKHTLEEICALQWKRCVNEASGFFAHASRERWIEVGYEDFVRHPREELDRILDFLGLDIPGPARDEAVSGVSPHSLGKGRSALDEGTRNRLWPLIQDTITRFGYHAC